MIDATILRRLGEVIAARKGADPDSSYVASLIAAGEGIYNTVCTACHGLGTRAPNLL